LRGAHIVAQREIAEHPFEVSAWLPAEAFQGLGRVPADPMMRILEKRQKVLDGGDIPDFPEGHDGGLPDGVSGVLKGFEEDLECGGLPPPAQRSHHGQANDYFPVSSNGDYCPVGLGRTFPCQFGDGFLPCFRVL
jgi:hypothetical protein